VNRAEKREQLTKKQVAEEAKQNREDEIQDNPLLSERQKILDEKKGHKRFNYCRSKIDSRKKKAEYGKTTKNDF
jgi:hypothetical protein